MNIINISIHLVLAGSLHKYRDAPPLANSKTITNDVTLTLAYANFFIRDFISL